MSIAEQPQTGLLNEQVIDRPDLEEKLERRAILGERRKSANKDYREADEAAKGVVTSLEIEGSARCGRWLISTEERPGGHVEFETAPSRRIRIKAVGE